jgi:hypothetical protein
MVNKRRTGDGIVRRIHGFIKTDHFIERQWERGVPDWVLCQVLKGIVQGNAETHLAVCRSRLRTWRLTGSYKGRCDCELFIVIKNGYLTTVYFAPLCLGRCKGRKNCETQLIQ